MQAKLTLQLDHYLIKSAELYSQKIGKSISEVVADFFKLLAKDVSQESIEITPIVRSLRGSLSNAKVDENDYKKHLEEKYL